MKLKKLVFLNRLKRKWKLENLFQVILVLCVFALTGTTVVLLKSFIFGYIGIDNSTSIPSKIVLYIIFVIPLYQILLIGFAFLLGQQKFFLWKMKWVRSIINKLSTSNNVRKI
jgi:fructose-specific phosphotransferase system IIC component